jgi:hypothetical protein
MRSPPDCQERAACETSKRIGFGLGSTASLSLRQSGSSTNGYSNSTIRRSKETPSCPICQKNRLHLSKAIDIQEEATLPTWLLDRSDRLELYLSNPI